MQINHQEDVDKRVEKNFKGLEVPEMIDFCAVCFAF